MPRQSSLLLPLPAKVEWYLLLQLGSVFHLPLYYQRPENVLLCRVLRFKLATSSARRKNTVKGPKKAKNVLFLNLFPIPAYFMVIIDAPPTSMNHVHFPLPTFLSHFCP